MGDDTAILIELTESVIDSAFLLRFVLGIGMNAGCHRAFRYRRCLIPANGIFEWERLSGKQAFHIHRTDQQLFAFAGLWEH
ncbi:SOS response-associated peptidase [Methylicorpusculum oleiharenae]|uniref:SOS response-associated peptidase family protein n=1 Tax=Methylicorpusculum oleiharenae TaxID=1338687 RepID=UPI001E4D67EE|nr:SOS response-associated peptidase [Methylicorpusculum oleiharenae]